MGATTPPTKPKLLCGPVFASVGDSEAQLGTVSTSTSQSYRNGGVMTWARILSKQAIQFPIANNFAVGGTTTAALSGQLDSALAVSPDFVFIASGTNNAGSGSNFVTSQNEMYAAIRRVMAAGAVPIIAPITPRTSGITDTIRRYIERWNRWILELGYGRSDLIATAAFPNRRYPVVLDVQNFFDYTSAKGDPIANLLVSDSLHYGAGGAYILGKQIADLIATMGPPRPTVMTTPFDFYDATNHPGGNLLFSGTTNDGLMKGTTGTTVASTGATFSGSVATRFQVNRGAATSTASITLSKESPRTDGPNGERQRMAISVTGAGASQESYVLQYTAGGNSLVGNVAAGDVVYAECSYEVMSAPSNLIGISLKVTESGPGSPQSGLDGDPASSSSVYPLVAHKGVLRTPPITLQSGTTAVITNVIVALKTDTGSASADVCFGDWAVRKQVA